MKDKYLAKNCTDILTTDSCFLEHGKYFKGNCRIVKNEIGVFIRFKGNVKNLLQLLV